MQFKSEIAIKPLSQSSSTYLDHQKTFGLKPDLILNTPQKRIIADTKYKLVYKDAGDPKNGIAQGDLYQVLAYAVRFKIDEVLLLYPDTIAHYQEQSAEYVIEDKFASDVNISIKACQLPVINHALFGATETSATPLSELFAPTAAKLKERLVEITGIK